MDLNTTGINEIYWRILWEYSKDNNFEKIKYLLDSVSPLQMKCKKWLVDELSKLPVPDPINVQLFGGWFGYPIIDFLRNEFEINYLENIDIDEKALETFKQLNILKNVGSRYRSINSDVTKHHIDVNQIRIPWHPINLVINTSSEHMPDLPVLIKNNSYKPRCFFALQSNNMFHLEEHINCVHNVEELESKSGLRDILYSGTLEMPNGYERYMVIGLQ
jgi:hypothetical protein